MKKLAMILACAVVPVSAANAQGDDPEMVCVSALADKMAVSMDQISSLGKKSVGEGTQVTLKAGDTADRWRCFVNDDGEVTSFEEVPAAKAKRSRR